MAQQHPFDREGTVPCCYFSVRDHRPGERFEVWRDSISSIFDVEAEKEVIADFDASIVAHLVGPLLFARTETRRQSWSRTSRRMAQDGMDHYLIQYFERGHHVAGLGAAAGLASGYVVVFDLSRPIANVTSDICNLSLLVPRPLLAERLERPDDMHNAIVGGALGRVLREHMQALLELAPTLDIGAADRIAEATVALAAACLNGARAGTSGQDGAMSPATIVRIKRFIDAHLHSETLTADRIARHHGVSRSKLYTMFERHGGVASYIRARRLQHAFRALRDPRHRPRSLYDIALEAGYTSDAAFCRAFKSQFDVTPGDVRRLTLTHINADVASGDDSRRYEKWLHTLGAHA